MMIINNRNYKLNIMFEWKNKFDKKTLKNAKDYIESIYDIKIHD